MPASQARAVSLRLNQTTWKDIDYLAVDLPPGTGDIQLTLAQREPVTGAVIAALTRLAAEIEKPCMPRDSASLCAASTIKCRWLRWMLRCTMRKSSRRAVTIVASRSCMYMSRWRRLVTSAPTRIVTWTGCRRSWTGRAF